MEPIRVRRADPQYRRYRSPRLRAPLRGVRVDAAVPPDLGVRCDAALLLAPAGAALSGRTAAQLYELPLPARFPGSDDPRPQLMAAVGGSTVDVEGLECRLCLLPAEHVWNWAGRRVTSPARTFLDLGAVLGVPDLVAVGDVVLRRGLATKDELAAVVGWAGRRRGVRTARRARELLDARGRSPQESRLRARICLSPLPDPEPNAVVHDRHGGFLAEGDLVWRAYRVLVEYDGAVHLDERQRRKDAVRRNQLAQAGWLVLVYTADVHARHPDRILHEIRTALMSRGWAAR